MQYKHWASIHHENENNIPFDVILECLVSLLMSIMGLQFFLIPSFKQVKDIKESKYQSYDGITFTEDFVTFNSKRLNPSLSSE